MSIATELDEWTDALGTAVGILATRDPDLIHPPCLFVGLPEAVTAPISAAVWELPVYVVGDGPGKQGGDGMLDLLPTVFAATGQQIATSATLTAGGATFPAYLLTVPVRTDNAPPAPPGPAVPSVPGTPYADAWIETGGGWQYDLHWDLSADDGGAPITSYKVSRDGVPPVTVNGNTGVLAAQFSLTYPVYCYVQAVNIAGTGPASPTATLTPPTP